MRTVCGEGSASRGSPLASALKHLAVMKNEGDGAIRGKRNMNEGISLEMLAFNMKLLGRKSRKKVLISAGKQENKKRMLPAIKQFLTYWKSIYIATPGTHKFLDDRGIKHPLKSIKSPTATPRIFLTFLKENRFDLVINVLTGDDDYDEASDAKLIRKLCIENGIPLVTDCEVGIATLEQLVADTSKGTFRYKLADNSEPWNLRLHFMEAVERHGGFANHHAHFDKAYLINMENLRLSQVDMQKKWRFTATSRKTIPMTILSSASAAGSKR